MKKPGNPNSRYTISGNTGSSINISGGDISHISTNINTGSGDLTLGDKTSQVEQTFQRLYKTLEHMPESMEKDEAQETLNKLEQEARKGEQADEGRVARWMNFLAETAPDVWQVAVETFLNPVGGIGLVFRKVAERAKRSARAV